MKKALIVLVTVMMTVALLISCGKDPFFHYVDFDSDGGTSVERQIVFDGEKAVKPADPTKDGVKFVDWYDGDSVFDFNTAIKGDTVLKAKWSDSGTTPVTPGETTYTVTYYNGTELVETKTFKENETVTIRDGADLSNGKLAFAGWSTTQGSETADYMADSAYAENKNITLYAVWSSTITITYKVSGAADVVDEKDVSETVTTRDSSSWTKPTGFDFDGWYTQDKGGGKYFEAGATVTESLVLYAHWIDEDVTVDGNSVKINSAVTTTATSVTIPSVYHGVPVTTIPQDGFKGCTSLTEVSFEKAGNITSTDYWAFQGCTSLTKVDLSGTGLTELKYGFFGGCTNLAEVTLPSGLTKIESAAFHSCSALESISLPSTLTSIGSDAFNNTGLKSITIPKSVTVIEGSCFYSCKSLKSIVINGEIKKLSEHTFQHCNALESVTLPDTLETIDQMAFENCSSLKAIEIPGSVTTILANAFTGCTSLTNITINKDKASGITPPSGKWGATSATVDYADTLRVIFNSDGGSAVPSVYPDSNNKVTAPTAPTKEGYYFAGWLKADGTFFDFNKDTVTEIITLKAKWVESFSIGDTGPGGGIIFYINPNYDASSEDAAKNWRYLEAAPTDATAGSDTNGMYQWCSDEDSTTALGTGTAIGTGLSNLTKIKDTNDTSKYPAFKACDDYVNNGCYDWFLPSDSELKELKSYFEKNSSIGNFVEDAEYWSSSEASSSYGGVYAYYYTEGKYFPNHNSQPWSSSARVRPCRQF